MMKYYPRDTAFYKFLWIHDLDTLIYYGLIALAIFLSVFLIYRKLKDFEFDLGKLKRFYIITAIIIYPTALVGSRLPDMFYRSPKLWNAERFIAQIWRANTYTFHGGLLFSTIVLFGMMLMMKFASLERWRMADAIFLYIPLCHSIGRASCLILGCCWGERVSLSLGGYRLDFQNPIPLYSIIMMLGVFLILRALHNYVYSGEERLTFRGLPTAFYFILYGLGRFFMETIRTNPVVAWGLTQAQIVMLFFVFIGLAILTRIASRGILQARA